MSKEESPSPNDSDVEPGFHSQSGRCTDAGEKMTGETEWPKDSTLYPPTTGDSCETQPVFRRR